MFITQMVVTLCKLGYSPIRFVATDIRAALEPKVCVRLGFGVLLPSPWMAQTCVENLKPLKPSQNL